MRVTVQVRGLKEAQREMELVDRSQVPFATALSLTRTAQDAQKTIQRGLSGRFTLRRRAFMEKGVRIEKATKAKLEAVVKDIHTFMLPQEESGTKTASTALRVFRWQNFVCVPLRGARPRPTALIREEDYPEAVMKGGLMARGFIRGNIMYRAYRQRGRGQRLIKGFAGGAQWSERVLPMYVLVPMAQIRKRYGFRNQVEFVVNAHWRRHFEQAFAEAQRTKH